MKIHREEQNKKIPALILNIWFKPHWPLNETHLTRYHFIDTIYAPYVNWGAVNWMVFTVQYVCMVFINGIVEWKPLYVHRIEWKITPFETTCNYCAFTCLSVLSKQVCHLERFISLHSCFDFNLQKAILLEATQVKFIGSDQKNILLLFLYSIYRRMVK